MKIFLLALPLLLAAMPAAAQKSRAFAADTSTTYELREVTEIPRVLNADDLREALNAGYPPELRAARAGGRVEVRFRVDAHGVPGEMTVTRSTDPRFDLPTIEALRKLRFSPAKVNDKPVAAWVLLPVEWTVSS
jgi:TonB family protein